MIDDPSRRDALRGFAAFLAGSPLALGQIDPQRPHSRVPGLFELHTALEFEQVMHARVPRQAYDYSMYGVDGEFTLRRNRLAFDNVELVSRATPPPSSMPIETATELLGLRMTSPFVLSPTAFQVQLHPDAEAASHRAAAEKGNLLMCVSGNASLPFDQIAKAATSPLWYQLYPRQEIEANRPILEGVQVAGAKAIVVTVDQQASYYERAQHYQNLTARQNPDPPPRPTFNPANPYRLPQGRLWYTWDFFSKIRPFVKVPILIKGILTAEDAKLALDNGVEGIWVSNHGGRSMDYGPASLEALPEIADAVRGRVPIIFDSGVRRGADAFKALALGATAVGLGRVIRFGLGAYGQQGVERVLEIMQAELVETMKQTGRLSVKAIDATAVKVSFS